MYTINYQEVKMTRKKRVKKAKQIFEKIRQDLKPGMTTANLKMLVFRKTGHWLLYDIVEKDLRKIIYEKTGIDI